MSSLIYVTDEAQVLTATDTLGTLSDGTPYIFTTKAFIVPHHQMIMCGIGMGAFLGRWFIEVNDNMIVRGIDNLDYHAPTMLRSIWDNYKSENKVPSHSSTIVYHFGFSEEDGLIHTYVYRSGNNFESESQEYGIGINPACEFSENLEFPRDIKKIMDKQRLIQQSLPKHERVHIGGKIQVHHLTKSGFFVHSQDQFEDFESLQQRIFDNYNSLKQNR